MEYQYITFLRANMISQGIFDEYGVCPMCELISQIHVNLRGPNFNRPNNDPHKCSCGAIIRRIHKQISFYDIEKQGIAMEGSALGATKAEQEAWRPLIYEKIKHRRMSIDVYLQHPWVGTECPRPDDEYVYLQKAWVHTERPRRDNEIIVFEKTIHSQGLYDLYYVCVCGEIDKTHQRTHLWCDSCRSLIKLTDKDVCFHYEYEMYKEFGFECLADKPDFLKEHYPHKVYYAPYVAIVRPDEDSD